MPRSRYIELNDGKRAKVDAKLYGWLSCMRWRRTTKGYAAHYFTDGIRQRQLFMHRLVVFGTEDDPGEVDHVNGDKLDNRRCNLRPCTHAENMALWAERRRCATVMDS